VGADDSHESKIDYSRGLDQPEWLSCWRVSGLPSLHVFTHGQHILTSYIWVITYFESTHAKFDIAHFDSTHQIAMEWCAATSKACSADVSHVYSVPVS